MKESIKVLLVEDEYTTAICLQMELEQAGYDVVKCLTTGEEAVEFSQKEPPDLIIMDISLAGEMDGVAATEKILSFSMIPVVFVTGYANMEIRKKAKQLNPIDYLVKPVSIQILIKCIDSYFNAHRAG